MNTETAVIRRISQVWKVAPYRIDVRIHPQHGLLVSLDGKAPTKDLVEALEHDIETMTNEAKARMN